MKDISSAHKPALSHKGESKQTNWEVETGDFVPSVVSGQIIFPFPVLKIDWAALLLVEELQGLPAASLIAEKQILFASHSTVTFEWDVIWYGTVKLDINF